MCFYHQPHAEVQRSARDAPQREVGTSLSAVDALGVPTVPDLQRVRVVPSTGSGVAAPPASISSFFNAMFEIAFCRLTPVSQLSDRSLAYMHSSHPRWSRPCRSIDTSYYHALKSSHGLIWPDSSPRDDRSALAEMFAHPPSSPSTCLATNV